MAPTLYDKKPEVGDLIEIFRGTYQHWAVYIGDGYVIHLAPPQISERERDRQGSGNDSRKYGLWSFMWNNEHANAGAYSMMSVLCDKAIVKREELWEVVGTDRWQINNLLDDKYEPRPAHVIVQEAKIRLNQELPYCVFRENCEHFATELRYGKAESRQVRKAVQVGVGVGVAAVIGVGVLAVAAALFGSGNKERESKR